MLSLKPLRALVPLATTAAIALAGCGDADEKAGSPLDEVLGYLSEDAGFAFVASTDVDDYDEFLEIADKFPFSGRIEDSLKDQLAQGDVDFDKEIKPLLGNEVVIGTDDNQSFVDSGSDTPFILALQTRDEGKLRDLVEKDGREQGSSEGYDIFQGQEDDTWVAIKDDVVVLSDTEETLKNALEQRGQDDRLTEDDFDAALEDLPEDAPVKGYANLAALLATDPDTEEALKVKWVDHLETLGFTADADGDGISIDYALNTDPADLSDEDLPMASGSDAPQLLERGEGSTEVAMGLRDPSQVVDFTLQALKVLSPADYAQYQTGKQSVGKRLGIDVDEDVLEQLTGDVSAVVALNGDFGVRAQLDDPQAFEGTLKKVMEGLPEFSDDLTVTRPRGDDGFYGLAGADGKRYAVGVAGEALVIANDAGLASEVASRDLVDADGQEGAFVAIADAEKIANEVLSQLGGIEGLGGSLFTGPLGDILTSAEASTDGITGSLTLEVE